MLAGKRVGVLGAGNIGEALIRGVVKACVIEARQIVASRRTLAPLLRLKEDLGISITTDNSELVKSSDIIVLAVKPQILGDVLGSVVQHLSGEKMIISLAAGITTDFIEKKAGCCIPVVRVMPNTPGLVGEAISAYSIGRYASDSHALLASEILSAIGVAVKVDEELLDPITAVSGTGPAYIFYLMEALIDSSVSLGIPLHLSKALIRQTVYGAAKLVMETGEEPAVLRARVTSPQGTTHAAITHLESRKFSETIKDAVNAAKRRAEELGKMNNS